MRRKQFIKMQAFVLGAFLVPWVLLAEDAPEEGAVMPADAIVMKVENPVLSTILQEVLDRNPELAAVKARAEASALRPDQVKTLPDPMAMFTAYVMSPETRVGPQHFMAGVSQKFPWFGKLGLREKAAIFDASAAATEVEAMKLAKVTEARKLYYEIAFQDLYAELTRTDRDLLMHYEEVARARYASGVGLQQAVVKIQAEITRDDTRLLNIEAQRAKLVASLNSLRDRPLAQISSTTLPVISEMQVDADLYRQAASKLRPEIASADASIQASQSRIQLSQKEYSPDFTVGLSYVFVGERSDPAGIMNPPPDNGRDILGVNFGINLPVRRKKLKAGVEESSKQLETAKERRRAILTSIDRSLGDLTQRIPLIWNQLRLFEDVLLIQAEESLGSAEAAYAAGTFSALELLDAERILLETRVAAARARTDYAVALSQLEGTIGAPLEGLERGEL